MNKWQYIPKEEWPWKLETSKGVGLISFAEDTELYCWETLVSNKCVWGQTESLKEAKAEVEARVN